MKKIGAQRNSMKKTLTLFLTLLTILIVALSLFGCGDTDVCKNAKGEIVIKTSESNVETFNFNFKDIDMESFTVFDVLKYLNQNDRLDLEYTESATGAFLTKVGNLKNGNGYYIYIYTSVESDKDVSAYGEEIEHGGRKLWSSGLGISSMSVEDKCVILFQLIYFG